MKILFKFLHNNFKKYSIFFVYLLLINIISCKLKAQDTSRCAAINVIANELFQNKTKFVIAALPNKFILDTLYLSNHNYYKNLLNSRELNQVINGIQKADYSSWSRCNTDLFFVSELQVDTIFKSDSYYDSLRTNKNSILNNSHLKSIERILVYRISSPIYYNKNTNFIISVYSFPYYQRGSGCLYTFKWNSIKKKWQCKKQDYCIVS